MKKTPTKITSEKELKSHIRAISILERSPSVLFLWKNNENWPVEYVSKNVSQLFGYTSEDFLTGKITYGELVHPNDIAFVTEEVTKYRKNNATSFSHKPYRIITKTGEVKWVKDDTSIERNEKGDITHYEGVLLDITAQQLFKHKLIESEHKYKAIIENAGDAMYMANFEGEIVEVNKLACENLGYSERELLSMNIIEVDANFAELEKAQKLWNQLLPGKPAIIETTHKRKDGSVFDVEIRISIATINGEKVTLGFARDITERKKAELKLAKSKEQVEKSEQKFRNLFEKSGDAIMIAKNGKIIEINEATVKMFGYTNKNEILNVHPSQLSPKLQPDGSNSFEKVEEMLKIASEKGTHRFEWIHKKRNGKTFPVEVLLTSIVNTPNNNIIHGVLRDITKYKRIEAALIKAKRKAEESDRLKTEFISNMSHEIRTPLNGILGFSELLGDPNLVEVKRAHFVKVIKSSGHQLLQVIDDILEIARLGTKQVKVIEEQVNINDLLLELFSIFEPKAKENKTPLFVEKTLKDKQSIILTDRTKLNKILSNLVENALKFTNTGDITLGYDLKTEANKKQLVIYVKDTGVGIAEKDQKMIFERFAQTGKDVSKKVKGLGLGLSIAKENTELLGGEISVESNIGKGTTFFVSIPYKPVYASFETENLKEKTTILIAEDEEVNYLFLDTLIKDVFNLNCNLIHAKNGQEAIDICKNNTSIDFILMDLKMPVLGGFEAAREIKKLYPTMPIIAQTAYSTKQEQQKAIEAGCIDFISKPINKDALFKLLIKFLPHQ